MTAGFISTLASAPSTTSFAMTLLLRISSGWSGGPVWVCIATLNLAMRATAVLLWAQCTPVQKIWNFSVPGSCLPWDVITRYNTFSAGEFNRTWYLQGLRRI